MAIIETKYGYTFEVDNPEDYKVGKIVTVPRRDPGTTEYVKKADLQFLAQTYASRAKWSDRLMKKYGADSVETLPESLFHIDDEQLWFFFQHLYQRGGMPVIHASGTGGRSVMEIYLYLAYESQARAIQKLWQQLGVKSKCRYVKEHKRWAVIVVSIPSYVKIRPMLLKCTSSRIKKRLSELDALVPFGYKVADAELADITDRIVEIHGSI